MTEPRPLPKQITLTTIEEVIEFLWELEGSGIFVVDEESIAEKLQEHRRNNLEE